MALRALARRAAPRRRVASPAARHAWLSSGVAALPALRLPANACVEDAVVRMWPELREVRRDLHRHPELGLEEVRTSQLVANRLRALGLHVEAGLGVTGVCATVVGLLPAPAGLSAVGLRADMDCLPLTESNDFAHKSSTPGRMHACGHDGHTAVLLGVAQYLAAHREQFGGKVHFLFQPAEENHGGAQLMIEDGVLVDRFVCDEVYGLHNWPYAEPGVMSVREGPIMASNDEFELVISGRGGHAALPHLAIDPIPVACQVVTNLQSIVSRLVEPARGAVLSVTQVHGGSAYNVIPQRVTLKGTIRSFRSEERTRMLEGIRRISEGVCAGFGATAELKIKPGYPATVNAPAQTELARHAARLVVGEAGLATLEPTMGAEDFAYMLQRVPGCYVWLGAHSNGKLHEETFDFDDNVLPLGAQWMINVVRLRLGAGVQPQ
jgi:amidohydrolase